MNPLTFTWYPSKHQHRQDEYWRNFWSWGGLLGVALLLFCSNLESFPLLEAERIIAQFVQEFAQTAWMTKTLFLSTVSSEAYFHQPPLGLLLLAIADHWRGDQIWLIRLPGAILAAVSVPLLYGLAKEIFVSWLPAFLSALIYLTFFPVVCWGRLALLDGMVLFWSILTIFCILRSRRDFRWSLAVGLSLSGLLLTHGLIGLLFCGLSIIFLAWDTPRLLSCVYFLSGILLGLLPAIVWYWLQFSIHGQLFFQEVFWQSWQTGWGNFLVLLGFYPSELLKYSWPWLIFAISGIQLIRHSIAWGWAKLILVWGGIYFTIICLFPLSEIHYLLPIYPPLALASGKVLGEVYYWPLYRPYPQIWSRILGSLSAVSILISLSIFLNFPFDFTLLSYRLGLILTLVALAFTLAMTTVLIKRRNIQFVAVLLWGMYVCLGLFISFPPFKMQ